LCRLGRLPGFVGQRGEERLSGLVVGTHDEGAEVGGVYEGGGLQVHADGLQERALVGGEEAHVKLEICERWQRSSLRGIGGDNDTQ